jgi:hypothetical protein
LLHNHLLLLLELLLLELLELQVLQVLQLLLEQSERVAAAARLHPQPLQLPSRARHSPQPDEGLLSKDASNTGSARMPRTLALQGCLEHWLKLNAHYGALQDWP